MVVDAVPRSPGYFFDELFIGQRFISQRITVTEDSIIRFALEWDPHDFHLDRERAKGSVFGQLVGSGLQTLLLTSRLLYDSSIFRGTALAGLGMDKLKFLKPLLPGDTIGACSEVVLKSEGKRQNVGEVSLKIDTVNHRDEVIMTHVRHMLISRRKQGV